jgi:hypothetical protein
MARMMGRFSPEMFLAPSYEFAYSRVKGVDLPNDTLSEYFMKEAFSLAPENVEPPYPKGPGPVAVVPLPSLKAVLILQRVDFRPPVIGEYENQGRPFLTRALVDIRRGEARATWFNFENIAKRTGYVEKEPSR